MQMFSIFKHASIKWICVSYIHTLRCNLQIVHWVHLRLKNVKVKRRMFPNRYRNLHFDIRHLSYIFEKLAIQLNAEHIFLEPHKWMTRILRVRFNLFESAYFLKNILLRCNMFIWGLYVNDIFCRRCTRYITPKAWNLFPLCCAINP